MKISKYENDNFISKTEKNTLPPVKTQCDTFGCKNPISTLFAMVKNPQGKSLCNTIGSFSINGQLKSEYTFQHWIARCAECLMIEAYHSGNGRWSGFEAMKNIYSRNPERSPASVEIEKILHSLRLKNTISVINTEKDFLI